MNKVSSSVSRFRWVGEGDQKEIEKCGSYDYLGWEEGGEVAEESGGGGQGDQNEGCCSQSLCSQSVPGHGSHPGLLLCRH